MPTADNARAQLEKVHAARIGSVERRVLSAPQRREQRAHQSDALSARGVEPKGTDGRVAQSRADRVAHRKYSTVCTSRTVRRGTGTLQYSTTNFRLPVELRTGANDLRDLEASETLEGARS